MAASGYSGMPLLKKLGIWDVTRIIVIDGPANYFELGGKGVKKQFAKKDERVDPVHVISPWPTTWSTLKYVQSATSGVG